MTSLHTSLVMLAGRHHNTGFRNSGSSGGGGATPWWVWLVIVIGVAVVIWGIAHEVRRRQAEAEG